MKDTWLGNTTATSSVIYTDAYGVSGPTIKVHYDSKMDHYVYAEQAPMAPPQVSVIQNDFNYNLGYEKPKSGKKTEIQKLGDRVSKVCKQGRLCLA